jgi:hypothetical protein
MMPVADLADRVRSCSGCHVGAPVDPDSPFTIRREVDHDMIAAGHPRLNFEFASYQDLMPRHWDAAEVDGPDRVAATRRWLTGRIGSEIAALDLLRDRAVRVGAGAPWPEFSEFDCFSCHHDLRGEPGDRGRVAPGRAARGSSWGSWYFADAGVLTSDVPARGRLDALREAMNAPSPIPDEVIRRAEAARESLGRQQTNLSNLTPSDLTRLAHDFELATRRTPPSTWDEAMQAYLGLVQINRGGNATGLVRLRRMSRDLGLPPNSDSPTGFNPSRFAPPPRDDPAREVP